METPVGEMVAATLGLLAFILGFTFGLAATRYDTKRQLLVDEANAVGTTYLRAEMLPERSDEFGPCCASMSTFASERSCRASLPRDSPIGGASKPAVATDGSDCSKTPNSIIVGLFVQSLNEVIDLHTKRLTAAVRNRIPFAIWAALYGISIFSFAAMGYHSGLTGTTRSLVIIAVAFTFSVVIVLIADLDRSQEGVLRVSQEVLSELRKSMK